MMSDFIGPNPGPGWQRTKLKYLSAEKVTTGVGEPAEYTDEDWPRYVRTTDIAGPRELRSDVYYSLPPEVASQAMLERGDVVLTTAGSVGTSYLHEDDEPACYAGYLARVRPTEDVDPRFLIYWAQSDPFWNQVRVSAVTSTIDNVAAGKYQNFELWLPDIEEQRRIADYLDYETIRLGRLLGKNTELNELLESRRQAVLSRAVTRGLNETVDRQRTDLPGLTEVPSHWSVTRLKYVVPDITVGIVVTPSHYYADEGPPCLRGTNVKPGEITRQDLIYIDEEANRDHSKSMLREGDVVAVRTGETGAAAVVPSWAHGGNCVDLLLLRRSDKLLPKFLEHVLNSDFASDQIARGSVGTIQSHFNVGALRELVVCVPPLVEQREIIDYLTQELGQLDRLREHVGRQRRLIEERRQALITAAMTGQIDVTTAGRAA